jgi:hypothetical protein
MISEEYYLAVNILFKGAEKKVIDENDRGNPQEIDITSIDGMKVIFKREVEEWLLKPIEKLLIEDAGEFLNNYKYRPFRNSIFVLFGLFAYIEKMELYRGNGTPDDRRSTQRLVDGMKRIFTNLSSYEDEDIKDILKRSRHNLMHQAMIGDDILLNLGINGNGESDSTIGFDNAVDVVTENEKQEIRINPIKMYDAVEKDFTNYLSLIDNDDDIKNNFESFFNNVYKNEITWINS